MTDAADRHLAEQILQQYRRVAVVGISADPARPSFRVASYLRDAGFDIVPVNPLIQQWRDLPCFPNLRAAPGGIEVVDVFRRSELVDPVVDEAIAIGAGAIWMQDGVINEPAAAKARAAGMLVVMDRCMMRDHMTLAEPSSQ